MSIDDVLESQIESSAESCFVCGKCLAGACAYARLKCGESTVALCCPLCLETFQKNPEDWTRRRETRREVGAIFELLRPKPATL